MISILVVDVGSALVAFKCPFVGLGNPHHTRGDLDCEFGANFLEASMALFDRDERA